MAASNNSISGIKKNSIDIEYDEIFEYCIKNDCNSCNGKIEECEECYGDYLYENEILKNELNKIFDHIKRYACLKQLNYNFKKKI